MTHTAIGSWQEPFSASKAAIRVMLAPVGWTALLSGLPVAAIESLSSTADSFAIPPYYYLEASRAMTRQRRQNARKNGPAAPPASLDPPTFGVHPLFPYHV